MRIACLHTSISNIQVFEEACPRGVHLSHFVDADLLRRANAGLTDAVIAETRAELARIADGSDAVLLTCSTLRPAVTPPAFAADKLLAEELRERGRGKRVEVLYCNPGTKDPTLALFSTVPGLGQLQVRQIEESWPYFEAGDQAGYFTRIREGVAGSDADLIVLAQASMAPALPRSTRIMTSPDSSLRRLPQLAA